MDARTHATDSIRTAQAQLDRARSCAAWAARGEICRESEPGHGACFSFRLHAIGEYGDPDGSTEAD